MKQRLFLLLALLITGIVLYSCTPSNITEQQAIDIASEHLQQYGHYPAAVQLIEAYEGEGQNNHYWELFGQSFIESPSKYRCWVVNFYYPGLAEGSHLVVFVDKNNGEVIGGTQTK